MKKTMTTLSEPTGTRHIKAVDLAEDFLKYCRANPDLRFWQALLTWSEVPWIFISNVPIYAVKEGRAKFLDPYHWHGKNEA